MTKTNPGEWIAYDLPVNIVNQYRDGLSVILPLDVRENKKVEAIRIRGQFSTHCHTLFIICANALSLNSSKAVVQREFLPLKAQQFVEPTGVDGLSYLRYFMKIPPRQQAPGPNVPSLEVKLAPTQVNLLTFEVVQQGKDRFLHYFEDLTDIRLREIDAPTEDEYLKNIGETLDKMTPEHLDRIVEMTGKDEGYPYVGEGSAEVLVEHIEEHGPYRSLVRKLFVDGAFDEGTDLADRVRISRTDHSTTIDLIGSYLRMKGYLNSLTLLIYHNEIRKVWTLAPEYAERYGSPHRHFGFEYTYVV